MLRRIKRIQSVGRFSNANCGRIEFDKITLIHGRNTYGKSTLGDIFSSLENGNVDSITKRKTIPLSADSQVVSLSFLRTSTSSEVAVGFGQGGWQNSLPDGMKLYVFDDGFYHESVFSSRKFNRETKEKLSAFILGQQGVAIATSIAEKNKLKNDAVRRLNILKKDVFQSVGNIPNFLSMVVSESEQEIQVKVEDIRKNHSNLTKQKKNSASISSRPALSEITFVDVLTDTIKDANNILLSSVESYHEEAKQSVIQHIKRNFSLVTGAEKWISQGMSLNNGHTCNFCGQILSDNATKLIDSYREYFNQAYIDHETLVNYQLDQIILGLKTGRSSEIKLSIEKNNSTISLYPELAETQAVPQLKEELTALKSLLNDLLESYEQEVAKLIVSFESAAKAKKNTPHTAIAEISKQSIDAIFIKLTQLIDSYNKFLLKINAEISVFKGSLNESDVNQKLSKLKTDEEVESLKLKRLQLESQCKEFNLLNTEISALEASIPKLQTTLSQQQSQFLDIYFTKLNEYFLHFGSENFTLEKSVATNGYMPVYYLKIKFHGINIAEADLDCVFSESDRRALALAIYAASIDALSPTEKPLSIVVMDDPVTSFDNHRISATHRYIVNLSDKVRQVIILSHFEDDIARFLHTYRKNKPVKLLEIRNENGLSSLFEPNVEKFLLNGHQKKFESIFKFINRETHSLSVGDFRVFLEEEIDSRFAKQIKDKQISENNLSDRIEALFTHSVISEDLKNELHEWREDLNPEHHRWTGADTEDQRNTARRFFDFLYHKLFPV